MSDYVTLIGSEDVSRAGHNMVHASDAMQRAILQFESVAERLIRALDDHATRVENAAKDHNHD
jgi:hypothetical protein